MNVLDPILDAALRHRLITRKQYKHVAEEMANFPGRDAREILLSRHFLTPAQLERLTDSLAEEVQAEEDAPPVGEGVASPPVQPPPPNTPPPPSPGTAPPPSKRTISSSSPSDTAPKVQAHRPAPQAEQSRMEAPAPARTAPPTAESRGARSGGIASDDVDRAAARPVLPEGGPRSLRDLLRLARHWGASDLHLSAGRPPFVRMRGELRFLELEPLTEEQAYKLNFSALTTEQRDRVREGQNLDYALELPDVGRHRCNIFRQRLGWDGVYRIIPTVTPSLEDLGMPPVVKRLTQYQQGMVLVTGPARSGKTTPVAAMVDVVNREREDHIITIEDPVEYVIRPAVCQVTQREVGHHTQSFHAALRAALREDPDIIFVGEMRDVETISIAMSAAETGHLVFGTLHTSGAARTISRIVDVFPVKQREQVTIMISESIRGIVSQRLIPRADGQGEVVAQEILVTTSGISALIRDNKLHQIVNAMQAGRRLGMQTMDDALMELVKTNVITGESAYVNAENQQAFERFRSGGAAAGGSLTMDGGDL